MASQQPEKLNQPGAERPGITKGVLIWKPEKRKVKDLKIWEENPRSITEKGFKKLKDRIIKRGFHDVVKIDADSTILSGNQRKRALEDLGARKYM